MKSIAELSNTLNVSKTSIYNILKKNEADLKEHTRKKQGKTFLDEYAERFLIDYYAAENLDIIREIPAEENIKPENAENREMEADSTIFNEYDEDSSDIESDSNLLNVIGILQKQLEIKDKQLERKDEQLSVKDAQIKDLTESIKSISLAFSDRDRAKQQELFLQAIDKKEIIEGTAPPTDSSVGAAEPPPKQSILKRIFKKK